MFRTGSDAFGNATHPFQDLECSKSAGGVLDAHAVTIVDESAVTSAFWYLQPKVNIYSRLGGISARILLDFSFCGWISEENSAPGELISDGSFCISLLK